MKLLERLKRFIDRIRGKYDQRAYDRLEDEARISRELQQVIEKSIKAGKSIPNIAKAIQGITNKSKLSAVTTARTETTRLVNRGRNDAFHEAAKMGIEMTREWIATYDSRTRDTHASMHGQEVGLDEPFVSPSGAELMFPGDPSAPAEEVINCFIGETVIYADSPIKCSFKHHYSGELITIITAGGIKFTCTPNHPILADKGWVGAAKLNISDDLIVGNVGKNFIPGINPKKNDIPITIANIHDFFASVFSHKRIASVNVNFHGDIPDGDIEIVSFPCFLMDWVVSVFSKSINNINFKFSDLVNKLFRCNRMIDKFDLSGRSGSPGNIRKAGKSFSFAIGCLSHSIVHRFRTISNGRLSFAQNSINNCATDIIVDSELLDGFTGQIELDQIVNIERIISDCHVYNLHTENNLYLVNSIPQNGMENNGKGVIAHNCRCAVAAKLKL